MADDKPTLGSVTRAALHLHPDNSAEVNLRRLLLGDLAQLGNARRERLPAGRTLILPVV